MAVKIKRRRMAEADVHALMTEQYRAELAEYAQSGRFDVDSPIKLKNAYEKWRVVSTIQKAVRRGKSETAVAFARGLAELEPGYAMYRMSVMALEDVGIGNVDTMAKLVALFTDRSHYKEFPPDVVAAYVAENLAEAAHDRNACDLLVISDWHPEVDRERIQSLNLDQCVDLLANDQEHPFDRATAAWHIAGFDRFKSPVYSVAPEGANFQRLMEVYTELGVDPRVTYASKQGANLQREGHPVNLGLVWLLANDPEPITGEIKDDDLVELGRLNHFLSAGMDMHTRDGKIAIGYFVKAAPEIRRFFYHHEELDRQRAIGVELFNIEGQQCRYRLQYPANKLIRQGLRDAQHISATGDLVTGEVLRGLIVDNLDVLQKARQRTFKP